MERRDAVDVQLEQWSHRPHDFPLDAVAISKRIHRLGRHLDQLATEVLSPYELDRGEFDVLATLLRSGPPFELTPTVLNRSLLISAGGLTKRLYRLEERGLVSRRLDPGDRRSLVVALSQWGRTLAEAAVSAHAAATARVFEGFDPDDRDRLADLLRELLLRQENTGHAPTVAQQAAA